MPKALCLVYFKLACILVAHQDEIRPPRINLGPSLQKLFGDMRWTNDYDRSSEEVNADDRAYSRNKALICSISREPHTVFLVPLLQHSCDTLSQELVNISDKRQPRRSRWQWKPFVDRTRAAFSFGNDIAQYKEACDAGQNLISVC